MGKLLKLKSGKKTKSILLERKIEKMAGGPGFEPRLPGPEPGVLPLNYPPKSTILRYMEYLNYISEPYIKWIFQSIFFIGYVCVDMISDTRSNLKDLVSILEKRKTIQGGMRSKRIVFIEGFRKLKAHSPKRICKDI